MHLPKNNKVGAAVPSRPGCATGPKPNGKACEDTRSYLKTKFEARKALPHGVPPWVSVGSTYFITVCCRQRGSAQLTMPVTAERLLASAAHYHAQGRWHVRLFLLMPDHVHALLAFPGNEQMATVLKDWKRYTARAHGVEWQRDWFEHRPRNEEEIRLKAAYIRENPVRKGLVAGPEEWPWILEA